MMVKVHCKTCGETGKLDIGDMTKDQTIKTLKGWDTFQCFGNHIELSSPMNYWEIDWNSITDEKTPTEEEFVTDLKSKYDEVYTTDELDMKYNVVGFSAGMCVVEIKDTDIRKVFDFVRSPNGKRYYIA